MAATTSHNKKRPPRRSHKRDGVVIPLVAVFLVILVAMAAFSIDVAYMELVQTQLKAATDAAAKAGTAALVQGKSDSEAKAVAIAMAAQNKVAGKALNITTSDISIGQSQQQADGTWKFVANLKPSQAMQINSALSSNNANGSVPLFFAPVLGQSTYSTSNTSVASAFACDICLALDRSHSMCFDQTGVDWSYPAPIYTDWQKGIKNKPQTGSRWLALDTAMVSFCNILKTANAPPKVAVVTWASYIGKNTTEYSLTKRTSEAVTTELGFSSDMDSVYSAVHAHSLDIMTGGTEMSTGMDTARGILKGNTARKYAKKIMILMTDGQWNAGRDPIDAAQDAADDNITIHTISFLSGADQSTMEQIASITGGKHYNASSAAALQAAFEELAYSLPVVLTK